jgi:hypothetical protein
MSRDERVQISIDLRQANNVIRIAEAKNAAFVFSGQALHYHYLKNKQPHV